MYRKIYYDHIKPLTIYLLNTKLMKIKKLFSYRSKIFKLSKQLQLLSNLIAMPIQ